jgi:hypothetical protein
MAIKKIEYCSWDGDPALTVNHSDGRIHGFHFVDATWKQANAANIAMEAPVMTEAEFKKRWPDIRLPKELRMETAPSKKAEELLVP